MRAKHHNTRSGPYDSTNSAQPEGLHSWRLLDLFRDATAPMLTRAAIAVAVAWVPLAVLSAFRGHGSLLSFLADFASQSRFLIVVPVLILGERPIHARYAQVAHHFELSLVADNEKPGFHSQWRSYEKLKNSNATRLILLLMTFALSGWLSEFLSPEGSEFLSWWKGGEGFRFFS